MRKKRMNASFALLCPPFAAAVAAAARDSG
jgi:hypothetical protein